MPLGLVDFEDLIFDRPRGVLRRLYPPVHAGHFLFRVGQPLLLRFIRRILFDLGLEELGLLEIEPLIAEGFDRSLIPPPLLACLP